MFNLHCWVIGRIYFQMRNQKYNLLFQYAGLQRALPDNVQILTLEPWKGFSFLLRLEHILENNEDAVLSKPTTVNLKVRKAYCKNQTNIFSVTSFL